MKFSKTSHVFIPSITPDYFAGFPGFFMTKREFTESLGENSEKLNVYGPSQLGDILTEGKYFIGPSSQIKTHIYGQPKRHSLYQRVPRGYREFNYTKEMNNKDLHIKILQNFR